MSTPSEVYDAVKAAIVGTSVTKAHAGDTLAHYEGPLEEMPLRDRTFVLQSAALDRVTERMGCQEWTLELDVAVVYQLTSSASSGRPGSQSSKNSLPQLTSPNDSSPPLSGIS